MKLTAPDIALVTTACLVLCVFAVAVYAGDHDDAYARIKGRSGELIYSLNDSRTIAVDGPLGKTVVSIENGKVSVIDSPCPGRICVRTAPVSKTGEWIACLPNMVMVSIERGKGTSVDATSY